MRNLVMRNLVMRNFVVAFLLLCCPLVIHAKIPIFYGDGDEITKVLSLPSSEEFTVTAADGKLYHADLGILRKQFSLFYIPVWNYGRMRYVLYTDTKVGEYDWTYYDLSRDDIAYLQSRFSGIPDKPKLPFWDAIGGKLVLLSIVFVK